jgi:hypothetical protein
MDFNSIGQTLKNTKTAMHILSPDGVELYAKKTDEGLTLTTEETDMPCRFFMVSTDSKQYRTRKAQLFNQVQRGKKMKFTEAETQQYETVACGIVGWENIVFDEGEGNIDLPHDTTNIVKFLKAYPPAFDQADRFMADRTNFFTAPASD